MTSDELILSYPFTRLTRFDWKRVIGTFPFGNIQFECKKLAMRQQTHHHFTTVGFICVFLAFCWEMSAQIAPASALSEFVGNLSLKGPMIGGTDDKLTTTDNWVGSPQMYPSTTRYVNWEFSFAHSGLEASISTEIDVLILKNEQTINRSVSKVVFDHERGITKYIDGYGSDKERIWTVGNYQIEWSIEGQSIAQSEFTILNDDLPKPEVISQLRIDAFEIYFKESPDGKRDYSFIDNYRFPQERVRLIGWRVTFKVPYSVNTYDLEARIKIWRTDEEQIEMDSAATIKNAYPPPDFTGELTWIHNYNWPRGSYRMEISVGGRSIATKDFLII